MKNHILMKIFYWVTTVGLCALMVYSAQMYFRNTEAIQNYFEHLQYPKYIVIPLAIAKLLGVLTILTNKVKWLKEWAYAGFFFDMVLASLAHHYAGDPVGFSVYGILILIISYILGKKVRP